MSVATETVFDTCLKIKHSRDSAVIVCGPGERVDGIFTERDVSKVVLAGLDPTTARIGDHMTISPVCVPKACDDLTAMRLMAQGRFRHLPVVDGGSLVGLHDSLCLGKALLHNGSKGMLLRAKNFVQSFFAAARKTGDEVSLATSLESLCAGDSSSLAADSSTTVFNALLRMAEHRSSALLVKVGDTICGIFTERDLCVDLH